MRVLLLGVPFSLAVIVFTVIARGQWLGTTPIVYGIVMVGLMLMAGGVSRALRRRLYPDLPACACEVAAPLTDPSNSAAAARR
jgi:hypothetical protein